MTLTKRQQEIIKHTNDLISIANTIYEMSIPYAQVKFYDKGQSYGWAQLENRGLSPVIRYNNQALTECFNDMLYDTAPHEVAHIVMFYRGMEQRKRFPAHGKAWKEVCVRLGGSGKRTGDAIQLKRARRKRVHFYIDEFGTKQQVGPRHHSALQRGKYTYLTFKRIGGGKVYKKDYTGRSKLIS